jgi:hypothetical protein
MEAVSNPAAPVEPARRRKDATLKPETGQLPAAPSLATLPYPPRPAFLPFHERRQRFAVLVGHRPAGKTVNTINDLVRRAIECEHPAQAMPTSQPIQPGKSKCASRRQLNGRAIFSRAFDKVNS